MKTEKEITALMETTDKRIEALQNKIESAKKENFSEAIIEALQYELTISGAQKSAFAWVLDK